MNTSTMPRNAQGADKPADRPRHPDRRPTLVFDDSFRFIKQIQEFAAADRNLPAIDHGILASAALALVAEMPEAPQRVIDRALQLIVERRRQTRQPST